MAAPRAASSTTPVEPSEEHQALNAAEKLDRIEAAAAAVTHLVRHAPDQQVIVPSTPAWTIAEVFAHVAAEVPRYEQDARGVGSRVDDAAQLAEENVRFVASLPADDVAQTGERLVADLRALRSTISGFGDQQPVVTFDGGVTMRSDIALGALLGEFLVHGYDIARTVRAPWVIDEIDVSPVLEALNAILPGWVDPARAAGHTATYALRIGGETHVYEFTDGVLAVDPPSPRRPDVRIRMRPVPALLAMYFRRSGPGMAIRGEALAWGRRPWLAANFARRFHTP